MTSSIKTDPKLWKKIIADEKASSRGGKVGIWSARKAQRSVLKYKKIMREKRKKPYKGKISSKNSLKKWTRQKWDFVDPSDKKKTRRRRGRYFPLSVRKMLSNKEKKNTNRRKRRATKKKLTNAHYTKKEARLVKASL